MRTEPMGLGVEVGSKKTFVWVIDWPGWCRGGKDTELAIASMREHTRRYAAAIRSTGLEVPDLADEPPIVETAVGGSGTDFGVPSAITDLDGRPVTIADADRLGAIVDASWRTLDAVVAAAPAALRKGPRGGGRDRDKMFGHTVEADGAYARELGIRARPVDPMDHAAIDDLRAAILDILRQPSDGSRLAERKWPQRYAARRIAWHALDHAWEIEDRTDP